MANGATWRAAEEWVIREEWSRGSMGAASRASARLPGRSVQACRIRAMRALREPALDDDGRLDASRFTADGLLVLSALPLAPLAHSVRELAEELFDKTDNITRGRVRRALEEARDAGVLYWNEDRARDWGDRRHYAILPDAWQAVRAMFAQIDPETLRT